MLAKNTELCSNFSTRSFCLSQSTNISTSVHAAIMPHLTSKVMSLLAIAILSRVSLAQIPCSSANALPVSEQANGFPNVDSAICHNDPECTNFVNNLSSFFVANDVNTIGFLNGQPAAASPNATLTCNETEHCLAYKNILFCINTQTGFYQDQTGGQGNLTDGRYIVGSGPDATVSTTTTRLPGSTVIQVVTIGGGPSVQSNMAGPPERKDSSAFIGVIQAVLCAVIGM